MTPPKPLGAQAFLLSSGGSPPPQTWQLFSAGGPGRVRWGISLGSIGPSPGWESGPPGRQRVVPPSGTGGGDSRNREM